MSTVLVTGASGFIGRNAAALFKRESQRVIGVARRRFACADFDRVAELQLGRSLEPILEAEPIDVIVHAANDTGRHAYATNVRCTTLWLEQARQHGVGLQIFLSSLSARPDAKSDYGRAKYELEQRFIAEGQVCYRLGLVIGNGGLFGGMAKSLRTSPVVPLLDNGRAVVHVLGIDCLCRILMDCIRTDGTNLRGRILRAHQPTAYSLRDVMLGIRRHYGYPCRFVPIPSLPVLWILTALERLPWMRLPVNSTNVHGLRQNQAEDYEPGFDEFGHPEESLDELIRSAARAHSSDPEAAGALP